MPGKPADTEVAIVGCGPVGAFIANLLGARGIHCVVIEENTEVYQLPRAISMDDEVMRALQAIGLSETIRSSSLALKGMELLRRNRRLLRRLSTDNEPQTLGHPLASTFHQPTLELHLRQGLDRYPDHVRLRLGTRVAGIQDLGQHLALTLEEPGGEQVEMNAKYLLGCDGARSFVRREFGSRQDDLGLHQPWVVIDALMKRDIPHSGHAEQICDPRRPATFVPAADPRRRWEFMVLPDDDPDELVQPSTLQELIRPWAAADDYTIERAVVYTFHALVAERWQLGSEGRAFLLGDAAHQMPPFLGQGMCAGFRDAFNLAWKLEAVLRHDAAPQLLNTYQAEREPHVRSVIKLAVQFGKLIQSRNVLWSTLMNLVMLAAETLNLQPPAETAKGLPIGSGFQSKRFAPPRTARCPFPQPPVSDREGASHPLDEVRGSGFSIVARHPVPGASADAHQQATPQQALLSPKVTLAETDPTNSLNFWLDQHHCDAVVLRPDHQPFGLYRDENATYATMNSDLQQQLRPSTA